MGLLSSYTLSASAHIHHRCRSALLSLSGVKTTLYPCVTENSKSFCLGGLSVLLFTVLHILSIY